MLSRAGVLGGHCREGQNPGPPRVWLGGVTKPPSHSSGLMLGCPHAGDHGDPPVPLPGHESPIKDNRGTGTRTPVAAFLQMPDRRECKSPNPGADPGTPESPEHPPETPQHPGVSPSWQVSPGGAEGRGCSGSAR